MIRRSQRPTHTETLFHTTTLFRSAVTSIRRVFPSKASFPDEESPAPRPDRRARRRRLLGARHDRGRSGRHREARCVRSEEHTSELQSLMRISYAVFCLKTKNQKTQVYNQH